MTKQIVKAKFTFTSYKFKIEKAVSFTNVSIKLLDKSPIVSLYSSLAIRIGLFSGKINISRFFFFRP